jgi:[acyl-carrier-protein] S-malonyltransferase
MSKTAFIFPGQGSQGLGMGREIAEAYPEAMAVFDEANDVLGFDLKAIMFDGPEEELKATANTQPALLSVSTAVSRVLAARGIKAEACAGHSLGEYSALVAAGYLKFPEALKLVRERGLLMAEADKAGKGGMAAVIGLDAASIQGIIEDVSDSGYLAIANYNCPGQIVISGDKTAIKAAEAPALEAEARSYITLEVSGAFHSEFMKPAAEKFAERLAATVFNSAGATAKVVSNVTARWSEDAKLAELLARQLYSPVRWEESVLFLKDQGFDTFVELGSGKVLRGLLRRIDSALTCLSTESAKSLDQVLTTLGG